MDVKYAFVDGNNASVIAAIAIQLDCPLIDSDSLLYIMSSSLFNNNNSKVLKFCPITGVHFSRIALDQDRSTHFVEGHVYNPSESIFTPLSSISCRIFSIIWGASSISQLECPCSVFDVKNLNRKNALSAAKKIVTWLTEVGPVCAIKTSLDLIKDLELRNVISECLAASSDRARFDVDEASQIIKELGINPINNLEGQGTQTANDPTSSFRSSEANLAHWPQRMLKAFRRGFICPFILSGVHYGDQPKFFANDLEFIKNLPSSFAKAISVRYLHYSLLYSYELSVGYNASNPSVIEIHPVRSGIVDVYSIPFKCIQVSIGELNREFIYRSFSYSPTKALSNFLNMLCLTLLIWFKQTPNESSSDESPIILSVVLCAMAQLLNIKVDPQDVLLHCQDVSTKAQTEYEANNINEKDLPECQYSKHIMHALVEIQNIYAELLALRRTLAALNYYQSSNESFDDINGEFLPCFDLFPSNKLIYWLSKCFYTIPSEKRRLLAVRKWIPQLVIQNNTNDISAFCSILTDTNTLLNHLKESKITLMDMNQFKSEVSFTTISEKTKNCRNIRKSLEGFLSSKSIKVKKDELNESISQVRASKEKEGSPSPQKGKLQATPWTRRKFDPATLKSNTSLCPDRLADKRNSPISSPKQRNYAAFLRNRVEKELSNS